MIIQGVELVLYTMLIDCFCQVRLICFIVYKPLNGVHDAQTNILLNGLEKIWHCIIVSVKKNLAHSSTVQTMKKQKTEKYPFDLV